MKKWILFVFAILFVGIGVLVYKGSTMGYEDYLDLAATFHEREDYDQEMFNLEKALQESLEINGQLSLETADIYRRMGLCDRDTDKIAEDFDKAILIYEIAGKKDKADLYYEKGKRMIENGGGRAVFLGEESLKQAIQLYEQDGYEDSDKLCESCLMLANLETDREKQWVCLKQAESYFWDLSKENGWQIGNRIYRLMGINRFQEGMYEEAFGYFDAMLIRAEDSEEKDVRQVMAEAQYLSGAALVLVDRAEEGKKRIEQAIVFYDVHNGKQPYEDAALAHTFLALAYGKLEPPGRQEVLEEGALALSYFTEKESIHNQDLRSMEYIKYILQDAYESSFPEKWERDFEEWFQGISHLKASEYYFIN